MASHTGCFRGAVCKHVGLQGAEQWGNVCLKRSGTQLVRSLFHAAG